jgi:hypothetical protein
VSRELETRKPGQRAGAGAETSESQEDPRLRMALQRRALQRRAESNSGPNAAPTGRAVSTPFGEFWVVPDDFQGPPAATQQPINERDFARLQAAWSKLQSNSGKIKISEGDASGQPHSGFKATVLTRLANLLSQPKGRELLLGLVDGSQMVIIRPSLKRHEGGANTQGFGDGKSPGGCTVELDPDLNDDTLKVFDATGGELREPAYITLGHELIHAQHLAQGKAEWGQAPKDLKYGDKEEEDTIEGDGLTENSLRHEHALPSRYGHHGQDNR